MGTSRSPLQVEEKFAALAGTMGKAVPIGVAAAAKVTKATIEASRAAAGAGSGRLRGVGKRGAAIGIRVVVTPSPITAEALVKATGPWPLLENDTPPHVIPKERARGKQRVAVVPSVGPRARVQHPGTKGKKPWAHGVDAARPLSTKAFDAAVLSIPLNTIF